MKDTEKKKRKERGGTYGHFCIKKEEQGKGEGRKVNCKKGEEKGGVKRKKRLTMYFLFFSFILRSDITPLHKISCFARNLFITFYVYV